MGSVWIIRIVVGLSPPSLLAPLATGLLYPYIVIENLADDRLELK